MTLCRLDHLHGLANFHLGFRKNLQGMKNTPLVKRELIELSLRFPTKGNSYNVWVIFFKQIPH